MIGFISGDVVFSKNQLTILKTTSGIGYEVRTPMTYNDGESLDLFIYHSISENDQTLWGFVTPEDRELFKLLLTVNKVGPSKAYPLIMTLGVQNLINGIIYEDAAILSKSPGIGKKMAEQIILSLKDKIKDYAIESKQLELGRPTIKSANTKSNMDDAIVSETMQALESLGYKDKDIMPLINKHYDQSFTQSEDLLKVVLREL